MAEQKLSPNSDYGRMTAERDALCQELESYRTWHAAALRMVGSDKDEFDSKPLVQYIQEMKDRLAAAEQAARTAGAWVPVTARLPEADGYTGGVLVARDVPYDPQFGDRDVTIAYRSKLGWCNDHGSVEQNGETVTHWMTLPEPPPSPVAGGPGGAERRNP